MPKRVVTTTKIARSSLPLSAATTAGNLVFVGGAVANNAQGEIVGKGDIRAQTRQALENVKALVEAAGGTLADVAQVTVYIRDLAHYTPMNEMYATYFPVDPPTRATLRVDMANPDFLIEITALAVIG